MVLTSAEKIVKDIKIGASPGCSNHALVEFMILRNVNVTKSGDRILNIRRANFRLFNEWLDKISWKAVIRDYKWS